MDLSDIATLSPREAQVLDGAAKGWTDKQLALELKVSVHTLKTYWKRIRSKLGSMSRSALVQRWTTAQVHNSQTALPREELEAFSYSVAHDLREPLRRVVGFTSLLKAELEANLSEDQASMLDQVVKGCRRMSELIDAHLSLSLIPRSDMQLEPTDLSSLAREVIDEVVARSAKRGPNFAVEDGLSAVVDRSMIRLLLTNLFENSTKFTARSDNATVSFGKRSAQDETIFFVLDNGVGFDQENVNDLFQPFHRLHDHPEFGGTGIGLTICDRIVRRHGGKIWAQGQHGVGATFFFTLSPPSRLH
jgi:light-regulated signal transduction histidine kinase (bacteriophytochrome)